MSDSTGKTTAVEGCTDQPLILVIEDEEVVREACLEILTDVGYRVELAENGMQGIEQVKRSKPDLVIVDIRMPGIDGIEALRRITDIDSQIVSIVITGFPSVEYAVQSMRNGAYDFLPKPFTPAELRMIVDRGLEKRRLVCAMKELEQEKKQMADFFISIVSHQLRTPLVAIKQYFEVILGNMAGEVSDETRDIISRADGRIDELIDLIKDWLQLARFDAQKTKSKFEPLDLKKVLEYHVEFLQPIFSQKHIDVQIRCCEDMPAVMGDENSLGEVFANLLGNAVKYNRENGRIEIRLSVDDAMCRVEFEDTGIGISEDEKNFVFDEFYRARNEQTKDIGGTGLGLAIVKKFVEVHGGSVELDSEYGKGSTFAVYLPIARQPKETAAS